MTKDSEKDFFVLAILIACIFYCLTEIYGWNVRASSLTNRFNSGQVEQSDTSDTFSYISQLLQNICSNVNDLPSIPHKCPEVSLFDLWAFCLVQLRAFINRITCGRLERKVPLLFSVGCTINFPNFVSMTPSFGKNKEKEIEWN